MDLMRKYITFKGFLFSLYKICLYTEISLYLKKWPLWTFFDVKENHIILLLEIQCKWTSRLADI